MSSSNHSIPIFISSTVYNLLDLRAELSEYLTDLGYNPMLSSESGFPDQTPKLSPWESCLPVLEKSFLMTLIIDTRYGSRLPWTNSSLLIDDQEISPTHGEYRFAKMINKRILVFVRKEIITYYQSYRELKSRVKKGEFAESEIKMKMIEVLPPRIQYDVFPFLEEVKTKKPIPWIVEFDSVVDVKKEIQKKLNNELAEVFLIKEQHEENLIKGINHVLAGLNLDERITLISKLNIQSDLIDKIKSLECDIAQSETEKASLSKKGKNIETLELKIAELNNELHNLKLQTDSHRIIIGSNNIMEYSNIVSMCCERCGCLGEFDSDYSGRGSVFLCKSCGKHLCEQCLREHQQECIA